jgi:hypothetical protein
MQTRTKWILITAEIIIIYSTLYIVRIINDYLRERGLLTPTIYILIVICIGLLVFYLVKRKVPLGSILLFLPVLILYGILFFRIENIAEKIHLIEYGLLGFMLTSALHDKTDRARSALLAFIIATAVGFVDEVIQYFLPNRIFDVRDILFNSGSGLFGIAAYVILNWIRIKGKIEG